MLCLRTTSFDVALYNSIFNILGKMSLWQDCLTGLLGMMLELVEEMDQSQMRWMYGRVNIPYIQHIWECSSEYEAYFFKAQVFLLKPSKSRWKTPGDWQWTCSWQFCRYTKLNLNHVEITYAKNWHWYNVTCWAWYLYVQVNHSDATWHNVPECDKVFCLGIPPHVRKILGLWRVNLDCWPTPNMGFRNVQWYDELHGSCAICFEYGVIYLCRSIYFFEPLLDPKISFYHGVYYDVIIRSSCRNVMKCPRSLVLQDICVYLCVHDDMIFYN